MNILKTVINGAANQFGREFGRAGANKVLKGANSYAITNSSSYEGRIKPSDSELIRVIKEFKKIEFVSTNKGNVSRLIELTDKINSLLHFDGNNTLSSISDYITLVNIFNEKYEHGSALIEDSFEDKSFDLLKSKKDKFSSTIKTFNIDLKNYIENKLTEATLEKRIKSKALTYAFPLWGCLGIHHFYLRNSRIGIISLLTFWAVLPLIFNIIHFFILVFMNEDSFDKEYNKEYLYYKQFKYINDEK